MIISETRRVEASLADALKNEQFVLNYQPKVDLGTGHIKGLEALIRWQHPQRGLLAPIHFLPHAERAGLMPSIDRWVLGAVCDQISQWRSTGVPKVPVALNVCSEQFEKEHFVETVGAVLQQKNIPPGLVEFELTESTLMQDPERAATTFQQLRDMGVKLALDDFGAGYSGLAYLKRLPFDTLKIDRSFIQHVVTRPNNATIVTAVITLAHSLNLHVVAEGVETMEQLVFLSRSGCDSIQGYYYSRPVAVREIEQMLRQEKRFDVPGFQACSEQSWILVVDDEKSIVKALQRVLQAGGYRTLGANSPEEALAVMAVHPVHVVISDHRMPGMLGIEFLDRIKKLYPQTGRLLLSGQADFGTLSDAINRNCVDRFIAKPWERDHLLQEVSQAVQSAMAKPFHEKVHI